MKMSWPSAPVSLMRGHTTFLKNSKRVVDTSAGEGLWKRSNNC